MLSMNTRKNFLHFDPIGLDLLCQLIVAICIISCSTQTQRDSILLFTPSEMR